MLRGESQRITSERCVDNLEESLRLSLACFQIVTEFSSKLNQIRYDSRGVLINAKVSYL